MFFEKSVAKINLVLLITGKNELNSNYHNISSIFCFAKDVQDTLEITQSTKDKDSITIFQDFAEDFEIQNNILYKTLSYFRALGYFIPYLDITLRKNIPLGSGMGGGSCNSASLIRFLVKNFGVKINDNTLKDIAYNLGADIPSCYESKACLVEDIGHSITNIVLPKFYLTLINPLVSKSTASFFKDIKVFSKPLNKKEMENISYAKLKDLVKTKGNDFTKNAKKRHKSVQDILHFIEKEGQVGGLTGSGLTCFAMHKTKQDAQDFANKIKEAFPSFWVKISIIN